MTEIVFTIEREADGGYVAVAEGVSIFTQGDSISEVEANIKEAVAVHFETASSIPSIRIRNADK